MERPSKHTSCFVIAPSEFSVSALITALKKRRIDTFFISDFLKSGKHSASELRKAFRSADLVLAFLVSGSQPQNVSFELGLAIGVGRRVLIFADRGAVVPEALTGLPLHYVDVSQTQNLVDQVQLFLVPPQEDLFVSYSQSLSVSPTGHKGPRVHKQKVSEDLRRIREFDAQLGETRELERRLSSLFKNLGWTTVEARQDVRSKAPDLALWIDEVQKDVGNPIATEVKASLSAPRLQKVVNQLSGYLDSAGAKAGLILYGGPEIDLQQNVAQSWPPIFAFNIGELTRLVEQEKFATALKASAAAAKRTTQP